MSHWLRRDSGYKISPAHKTSKCHSAKFFCKITNRNFFKSEMFKIIFFKVFVVLSESFSLPFFWLQKNYRRLISLSTSYSHGGGECRWNLSGRKKSAEKIAQGITTKRKHQKCETIESNKVTVFSKIKPNDRVAIMLSSYVVYFGPHCTFWAFNFLEMRQSKKYLRVMFPQHDW